IFDHPTPTALTHHLLHKLTPHTNSTVDQALERIGSALEDIRVLLADVSAADIRESQLPARLSALLAELTKPENVVGDIDLVDQLESASADELFQFIDSGL
ncbi:hypothetical protein ND748_30985, partial [Frankia sp. AiPs1]